MSPSDVQRKLEDAGRKAAEAKAEMERQQQRIRDLTIAGHLERDSSYQKLHRQFVAAKDAIHKHRLKMGRKRFSIKCTKGKLDVSEKLLAKMAEHEAKLVSEATAVEQSLEAHKDRIAGKIGPTHDKPVS